MDPHKGLPIAAEVIHQDPWDIHVFGFTADEAGRIKSFERDNDALWCDWILSNQGVTKKDCYSILLSAGIDLPYMYKLGYKNNNCIGCVKGGLGYWNKIRVDFPEYFERMAVFTREMGVKLLKYRGERIFLDELPEGVGQYSDEPDFECGPQCVLPAVFEMETVS